MHLRLFICTIFATFAILTNAMAAIDNCSYETTNTENGATVCNTCNTGYALVGYYSCFTDGHGVGTRCIFYCDVSYACDASKSTSNGVITTTYTKKSSAPSYCITYDYCHANSLTATSGDMSTSDFCSSQTTKTCAAGYYGYSGYSCAPCPNSKESGIYTNSAHTSGASGQSAVADRTDITVCYIPAGIYYNSTGVFKTGNKCNYSK